jgi:CheY-like chemotaxis protein
MFMINDILDYSQISNGILRLNSEYFSVWDIIKDVSKLIKFKANTKGLLFKVECNINSDENKKIAYIRSDPNPLMQILLNLFGNALKFTERGSVVISLESAAHKYIIRVTDTGVGIKPEDRPKLFQLSSKIGMEKKNGINKYGVGLGLGKFIIQSLVKILNENVDGAEIQVISEFGKGSCFFFPLLIKQEEEEIQKTKSRDLDEVKVLEMSEKIQVLQRNCNHFHSNASEENKIRNKRIIVVDDDQINILVASNLLRSFPDYAFDTANNGLDAIQIVKRKAPVGKLYDVILMDCNMPKLDGFETTKVLKEMITKELIQSAGIIACTANASPLDYKTCLKSGITDYISMPFSKYELGEKIEKNYKRLKR